MQEEPVKIVIIQLTRIGDLIQTVQATRQFKAENPEASISLIARRKFAKGLMFLLETVFDEIILFDTKDFFRSKTLKSGSDELHSFINNINQTSYDYCVNLSFGKSSGYLSSLVNAKHRLGIFRNHKAELIINDRWSQFVYSNVLNNTENPFSLVDIYKYIVGVEQTHILDPDPDFEQREANVVIHPFASQRKKKWGISRWGELIYKMAKDNPDYKFHIVGGKEDIAEAQRLIHTPSLQNLKERIIIHAGNASIAQTYQILMNSRLFIGHDSMVSHLASETLTPGIVISLGTVRHQETTPYGRDFYNIIPKNKCYPCAIEKECELLPCHNSINHQVISVLANSILNKDEISRESLTEKLTTFHLASIEIFTTDFTEDGIIYKEVLSEYKATREVFKVYYDIIWQYYLRGIETNKQLPMISPSTAQELSKYLSGINYLYELYNFGMKYSNKIIEISESENIDIKAIQENINKLGEIDNLCNITKKTYPLLKGLVDYFYVNKANAIGDNLVDISKNNLLNYYDASNLVAVLHDFIEKSIKPHVAPSKLNKEV